MKQQAGIGILLALTTAICWGALPIAMKQVLEVMEPPTIVFYRFLMASIGLGAILAVKKRLPPLRVFRKPRWLILLAVATAGLFGNFILFSSSLQYLSPTASQVIGQLSPVGMMVASVFILKEKMRSTQVVGALMLLSGLVMFFNTSLVEIFTKLTDYTWGVIFGVGAATVWVSYGVAQKVLLRRLASAIGDQENDIAMIEYAGVGVAMDNAIPSVKEVANFVTKSNLEDGVAFAIEKYVLN